MNSVQEQAGTDFAESWPFNCLSADNHEGIDFLNPVNVRVVDHAATKDHVSSHHERSWSQVIRQFVHVKNRTKFI